ncbi:MAG: hypothetical protein NT062_23045 [Proteobacteria bacterium]|nr:hypothetical protein [Pseudomonadota bacterium]
MAGERRAIVVSRDPEIRRVVGQALGASGLVVEALEAPPAPGRLDHVTLIVVDRLARETAGEALRGYGAPVIVVGDDLDDDGLVALMLDAPVSHAIDDPADRAIEITSKKLASGDLFGLEKYLAVPTDVHERQIATDADRYLAVREVCSWAEGRGARRPLIHRIESVTDELLMNALHDTPVHPTGPHAILRWAHDGDTLAISVGDACGALVQRDIVANVRRARASRGRPRDSSADLKTGAGLGLYLVMANVASLIVNVERGRRTEVVCLFDLKRGARQAASPPRALHVFAG